MPTAFQSLTKAALCQGIADAVEHLCDILATNNEKILAFAPFGIWCIGWLALYGPVYTDYASGAWTRDENAHAPFLMAICLAFGWAGLDQAKAQGKQLLPEGPLSLGGGAVLLAIALLVYWVGVVTEAEILVSSSQIPMAIAGVLLLAGFQGLRALWFPLLLTSYLIIWPGWFIDTLTFPLKMLVSEVVTVGLFSAGLPVSHAGAIISAGPYQLLVADACSGLNSLIALTAVGAVYLKMIKRPSWLVNAILVASLVPIAVIANMFRVAILVFITVYLGYDAGQSFLHEGAGLVMFAAALATLFAFDGLLAMTMLKRTWSRARTGSAGVAS